MTLGACLADVPLPAADEIIRPTGKIALELANLPAGTGVRSPGKKESTRPGGHWGYKQGAFIADLGKPARTVTASSQQDWLRDPELGLRRLCPRECAAIQSFPAEWEMAGNRQSQYRLIGNAVPPRLAQALGLALGSAIGRRAAEMPDPGKDFALSPLPAALQSAITYTMKEEYRNGASRRATGKRVTPRVAAC